MARVVIYTLLFLPLAFIFLGFASRDQWMILLPFRLVFGWLIHATKALPHLFGKWEEVILPLGCLLMAAVIGHRFVQRWVDEKFPSRQWSIRHTAGALSLLLLGSAAAIALSGVVHQMFWLAGGKVIYKNTESETIVAMFEGRQLMEELMQFQAETGRYPHSFDELENHSVEKSGMIRSLTWLDSPQRIVPERWMLLRPGSSEISLDDEPVIISPVIALRDTLMVGYGDSRVRAIRVENLAKLLSERGITEGGRGE